MIRFLPTHATFVSSAPIPALAAGRVGGPVMPWPVDPGEIDATVPRRADGGFPYQQQEHPHDLEREAPQPVA
jgi:hypothetical protein